ncbi:MAG: Do family serine endopeptidase [Gammaproteobacteria bacterium]|nr:Do family serine endopeptidase [Gammaproteobacteria bacterium]
MFFTVTLIFFSNPLLARGGNLPDFTQLVEDVAPAVVNISATRKIHQQSRNNLLEDFFRRYRPPEEEEEYAPSKRAEGSGFILSEDGYVLTNRHVVIQADEIVVKMNNGREFIAELIGEDDGTDVALLKIDAEDLPVIQTGHSGKLKVGEWVLGFGAPFGFEQTVTAGIVSAKKRTLGREQYVPYIQTDVAINPGNSGGPLVSLDGKVVGINSQILSSSGGYIGLSFAIPIELALHVVDQFKEYGKVRRGYLGVLYQEVDYALAKAFDMKKVEGAVLTQITEGSAAAKAGLKVGDIVLRFDGQAIQRAGELPFIVGLYKPGTEVEVDLIREGESMEVDLVVGERPGAEVADSTEPSEPETDSLGLIVKDIDEELRQTIEMDGIRVVGTKNGPAARAGIRRGDIILSIGNRRIKSVKHFRELSKSFSEGANVPVLVLRPPGIRRFFSIRMP